MEMVFSIIFHNYITSYSILDTAGNMESSSELAVLYAELLSYNIIFYDYRGFGQSSGKISHKGMKEDLKAVVDYAKKCISGEVIIEDGNEGENSKESEDKEKGKKNEKGIGRDNKKSFSFSSGYGKEIILFFFLLYTYFLYSY
jgi:hypothetical protein